MGEVTTKIQEFVTRMKQQRSMKEFWQKLLQTTLTLRRRKVEQKLQNRQLSEPFLHMKRLGMPTIREKLLKLKLMRILITRMIQSFLLLALSSLRSQKVKNQELTGAIAVESCSFLSQIFRII